MKYLFLIIAIFLYYPVCAQTNYNYYNIPDSLKKDADYIVWEDKMEFKVLKQDKAIEKVKYAVCIVDQHSKRFNHIYVNYRKGELVSKFSAEIYDANGKLIKKLKKSDIKDHSSVSDFSLFEDDRVLTANFIHNQYPYTLVYEYEKKVNGLLNYPRWYFQGIANSGILLSELRITVPESLKFKFKEYNLSKDAEILNKDGKNTFIWTEKYLKPIESISQSPPLTYYEPMLRLAPVSFSEGGVPGYMNSWNAFGKWNWELNNERDILPETAKSTIKNLVKDAQTEKEKVRILYQYMQNKTRYVSVQLGIGGYQTFPAEYVDTKGYGDCKALSNYMYAMLKEVGIKSHYTLVRAGRNEDDILTDFPSNQFNHVILCVPQEKDTIWLECTSQQQPFNFLGSFTDDRHALLVTENGGKLVKTPKYGKEVNTQLRKAIIKLDRDGNALVTVNTYFNGLQYENRERWLNESVKEQKDWLKKAYTISGMEIISFKFTEHKNEIPSIHEELDLSILRFASTSNKRMFIKLNVFNQSSYVPKNEERHIPFQLTYEFVDVDTARFELPEGYIVENMPKEKEFQTKFGAYSTKIEQNNNTILYIRKFISEKGIFPASDYKAYYDFRKKIKSADKAKLVLVKK